METMSFYGLGIGAILLVIGGATYYLAPRVGPNPIFGVRIGYAYASREVWDRTNRFGGALMALTGLALSAFALGLQAVGLTFADGMKWLGGATVVIMVAELGVLYLYARNLAQGSTVQPIAPVRFRWSYLAPAGITLALLLALAAWFYPALPAERIATHFNFAEQPDGYMSRDGFYASFLGLAALCTLLNGAVVLVATREPLIALSRWGSRWMLEPPRGLYYIGAAMAALNLILMVALWDVVWFNTHGAHAFPLSWLLWLTVPVVIAFTGLYFVLGTKRGNT
jgi:uncharacterized membrane protein